MTQPDADLLDLDALEPVALEEADDTTPIVTPPGDCGDCGEHADEPQEPQP